MSRSILAAALVAAMVAVAPAAERAQSTQAKPADPSQPPPVQLTAQQDHKRMMQLLKIEKLISYGASEGPGAEGQWVDQKGSFMAAVAAGPVFKLLGKQDLGTSEFPPVETGLTDGELAFRQHRGGHTTGPNWPTFLAFADRYIKGPPPPPAALRPLEGVR